MRKSAKFFSFIISISVFISCSNPSEIQKEEEISISESTLTDSITKSSVPTGDNSQTSVDWAGTYFATLPCGRCEGIEMWVTLNSDGTFSLNTNYLGLNDALEEEFTGKFTWNESGGIVTLEGLRGIYPGKFKVGENRIWYLDVDGNQMTGTLADQYILTKK